MPNPDSLRADVLDYYNQGREDARLRQGRGRLELWRTQDILRRWLPAPPARVLDIGGGTGIHAEWLASAGYDVELVDAVPHHVEEARGIPGVHAVEGDARSLDAPDGSADVVLLLGPLYHLPDREDRVQALTEAARVARPGGLVAAAMISRYASAFDSMRYGWLDEEDWVAGVGETVETGRHDGRRYGDRNRFTTAYFHHPADVEREWADAGLDLASLVAVEGPAAFLGNLDELLDDEVQRAVLLRWLRQFESDRSLLGATGHLIGLATLQRRETS
jgi:SAM-dependent methyltransferase